MASTKQDMVRVVKARQANHHSFILPRELWEHQETALYKNIARWGLIHQRYFCCDDVADNFGISVRQATNVISMLHRRYHESIECRIKRIKSGKGNVIKTHILILSIHDKDKQPKKSKHPETTTRGRDLNIQQWRNKFLFQRSGQNVLAGK